jgi:uncharacterized oligopeptide transporter (OPT) family protein
MDYKPKPFSVISNTAIFTVTSIVANTHVQMFTFLETALFALKAGLYDIVYFIMNSIINRFSQNLTTA